MSSTIISDGQSLLDVAIQELGSVAAVFDLATTNGLAITDVLIPGQVLVVPVSVAAVPDMANYFASRSQRINTSNGPATTAPPSNGIFNDTYDDTFN